MPIKAIFRQFVLNGFYINSAPLIPEKKTQIS